MGWTLALGAPPSLSQVTGVGRPTLPANILESWTAEKGASLPGHGIHHSTSRLEASWSALSPSCQHAFPAIMACIP